MSSSGKTRKKGISVLADDDGGPNQDSGEVEKPKERSHSKEGGERSEVSKGYPSGHTGEKKELGVQR